MNAEFNFSFGNFPTRVFIQNELPDIRILCPDSAYILVCDVNSAPHARKILGKNSENSLLVLEDGEKSKEWKSVESILHHARSNSLGRDGMFIGVGGGVISDLVAFAASIYMRGVRLCIVSTTLLGMIDASLGGKTGVNLFSIKNLAGTFFPACKVFLPLTALDTLPEYEWKSGMAELIKTAVLDSHNFLELVKKLISLEKQGRRNSIYLEHLKECIARAVAYKGKVVTEDFLETGETRALLNLGHTFGHALESAAGLGAVSHGEAIAWGMIRSCELGLALGITPRKRAEEISGIISGYGYETAAPHPMVKSEKMLFNAMQGDKKKSGKLLNFIVPSAQGARHISEGEELIQNIINGKYPI